ncbi:hypothetical protein [Agreia sp. COWG]|uniref:hypothetical protein n=1 Tax=Agreia sp. COWG TaxID=2773266 RepID=UPI00192569B8|nr:hypothetical protein [Agreia sp. COWG]
MVDEFALPDPVGWVPKRSRLLDRIGFYVPTVAGAPTTTRQAEILNPAVIAAPMQFQGLLSGVETLAKTPSTNDQIQAYADGLVDSPNVCTTGDVGVGKSTLMKCDFVLRPMGLKGRRVVVVDIKPFGPSAGYGEYTPLAEEIGEEPIRFEIGDPDSSRLNLLDSRLRLTREGTSGSGAVGVLQQAAAVLNDNVELDRFEKKAVRTALRLAEAQANEKGREVTVMDVLPFLGNIDDIPEFRPLPAKAQDVMFMAGYGVRVLLERVPEELPGLFDLETSKKVKLGQKATFFDFSQLPEDGPARSIGMMLTNAWTLGTIKASGGKFRTNFCVDEGWFLVGGPMGKVMRSNAKLSRALGLSNIVNLHHVSDVPPDDPAIAFIKEAGTLYLYRQSKRDDAEMMASLAGLKPGGVEQLMTLPKGQYYKKMGLAAETRVRHVRSATETRITDTTMGLLGAEADS